MFIEKQIEWSHFEKVQKNKFAPSKTIFEHIFHGMNLNFVIIVIIFAQ